MVQVQSGDYLWNEHDGVNQSKETLSNSHNYQWD